MADLHVTGLADLQKFLDALPAKMEANVMRSALSAGARIIRDEAKANCPVGAPNSENAKLYGAYAGALRDSIRVSSRIKGGKVTASIKAGGKSKGADTFYAHMVEYATAAHIIKAKPGGRLAIGGGAYRQVNHPGTRARPFMRPSLDAKAGAAVVAVGEHIKKRLSTRNGLDTSDISIEVEE